MDSSLRDRVKSKLEKLANLNEWIQNPNDPTTALEYIEGNVTSLANIWANIEHNLDELRAGTGKDETLSQMVYTEAMFKLDKLKQTDDDEKTRRSQLKKILALVDVAITNCPFERDQLARLFGLRSMALLESGEFDLALVAVNQALSLSPDSILYHTYKARCLDCLDRHYEAYHLIKRFLRTGHYPRAIEEEGGEEALNMESLRKLQADIDKRIAREGGHDSDDDASEIEESDDEDSPVKEASYDSDKDDLEQDFLEEARVAQNIQDEYDTPNGDGMKNFSLDYRCEFKSSAQKGRAFFATDEIPEKTSIFREKAYSIAILSNKRLHKCHFCARDVSNRFWPCHNCNQMVYCAKKCATSDWKLSHSYDCGLTNLWEGKTKSNFHMFHMLNHVGVKNIVGIIKELKSRGHLQYDLEAYRTDQVQRLVQEVDKDSDMLLNGYSAQMCLMDHSDKYEVAYLAYNMINAIDCAILACLVQGYDFDQITRLQLIELIGHCFVGVRRILTNAFRWSEKIDGHKVHISTGLYLMGSMFNHSCDPNAEWTFVAGQITMYTLRSIEPGEEITISYGPFSGRHFFEDRQKRLADHYYFQCQCSYCLEETRLVLALQCPACPGPVTTNPLHQNEDSHCLACFKSYPQTNEKMALLKGAIEALNVHGQLVLNCAAIEQEAFLNSMKQSLDQIQSLIYSKSVYLLESIYVWCKVLYQKGQCSEAQLGECIRYGAQVDSTLPLKGLGLIVLTAPKQTEQDDEGDQPATAAYYNSNAISPNIDYTIFWTSIYQAWIKDANCKDAQVWTQMLRFNRRLRNLIKWSIKNKEQKLKELKVKVADRFDNTGLKEAINVLESLKFSKQQELERTKRLYGQEVNFSKI